MSGMTLATSSCWALAGDAPDGARLSRWWTIPVTATKATRARCGRDVIPPWLVNACWKLSARFTPSHESVEVACRSSASIPGGR